MFLTTTVLRFNQQIDLLDGLPVADGISLLRELDPNGEYGLRNATDEQLAHAVSMVHGVPRALEVLAGIMANDPFADLTGVLKQFYKQDDVVQALIEENYKRLDANARKVIDALAVFGRPVLTLAVDYLLEPFASGLDVPSIMYRLTQTNIVSIDRETKTVTLHPIDRDYGYNQLPEEKAVEILYTRQSLERRAADYYAQLRTPTETWQTIFDLEPQLIEFEHRVRAGDYDNAALLLDLVDLDYLFRWGHYVRLVELRKRLIGKLNSKPLELTSLGSLGRNYRYLGKMEEARGVYNQSLILARELNDRKAESELLGGLGRIYQDLQQMEQAISFYEEGLVIARELDNGSNEEELLGYLGKAYSKLGRIEQAIEFYEQSLILIRKAGNRRLDEGIQLGRLGRIYTLLGQPERAIETQENAIAIYRETGARWWERAWLCSLSVPYLDQGQTEQAIHLCKEAIDKNQEIGDIRGEAYFQFHLGKALLVAGSLSEANGAFDKAWKLEIPDTSYKAGVLLGVVQLRQQEVQTRETFMKAATDCRIRLDKETNLYEARYALATALVGIAVTDPLWGHGDDEKAKLLTPALIEYRYALQNCAVTGVVKDALRDLEMIQKAGVSGLENIVSLLQRNGT